MWSRSSRLSSGSPGWRSASGDSICFHLCFFNCLIIDLKPQPSQPVAWPGPAAQEQQGDDVLPAGESRGPEEPPLYCSGAVIQGITVESASLFPSRNLVAKYVVFSTRYFWASLVTICKCRQLSYKSKKSKFVFKMFPGHQKCPLAVQGWHCWRRWQVFQHVFWNIGKV